jgi:hypothetical protein
MNVTWRVLLCYSLLMYQIRNPQTVDMAYCAGNSLRILVRLMLTGRTQFVSELGFHLQHTNPDITVLTHQILILFTLLTHCILKLYLGQLR